MTTSDDELEMLRRKVIYIIDTERSRYKVSVAVAEFIQARDQKLREQVLENFRVFCYEDEAFKAWDSPASNRQGWLDTKLREFVATLDKLEKGEE